MLQQFEDFHVGPEGDPAAREWRMKYLVKWLELGGAVPACHAAASCSLSILLCNSAGDPGMLVYPSLLPSAGSQQQIEWLTTLQNCMQAAIRLDSIWYSESFSRCNMQACQDIQGAHTCPMLAPNAYGQGLHHAADDMH